MAEKSFFIHFREQGRATAHDFVVAHFARNHYLCIVFPKRKPIKAYGEADRWRLALKKKADKRKEPKEN